MQQYSTKAKPVNGHNNPDRTDDDGRDFDLVALLAARHRLTRPYARVVVEHLRGSEAD